MKKQYSIAKRVYNPLNKLVRRIRMKYVYITSFGIIFTFIVVSLQALINPQNWNYFQDFDTNTWMGIGVGFALLIGFALFCLKQVRKIDEKDKETQMQELRAEVRKIFKETGLLKSPEDNEKNKEDTIKP